MRKDINAIGNGIENDLFSNANPKTNLVVDIIHEDNDLYGDWLVVTKGRQMTKAKQKNNNNNGGIIGAFDETCNEGGQLRMITYTMP